MNKDTAAVWLPLVQALADGKKIQIKKWGMGAGASFFWKDTDTLDTSLHPSWYRIKKPVPREYYVTLGDTGLPLCTFLDEGIAKAATKIHGGSYIKVVEEL